MNEIYLWYFLNSWLYSWSASSSLITAIIDAAFSPASPLKVFVCACMWPDFGPFYLLTSRDSSYEFRTAFYQARNRRLDQAVGLRPHWPVFALRCASFEICSRPTKRLLTELRAKLFKLFIVPMGAATIEHRGGQCQCACVHFCLCFLYWACRRTLCLIRNPGRTPVGTFDVCGRGGGLRRVGKKTVREKVRRSVRVVATFSHLNRRRYRSRLRRHFWENRSGVS